jgi:exopolyphosphatase/guanosine-5'-triphosphate,3'-diphosphate pyrophosphatase
MIVNSTIQESVVNSSTSIKDQDRILAAIDIGTNSIHMVVVRVHPAIPAFTIIAKEKDTVRLGARDPKTGELTPAAMKRAISALQRCQELAKSFNAEQIVAVATSAVEKPRMDAIF